MSFLKIYKFLLFLILCSGSLSVSAQKFSLGLKGGILGVYTNFPDVKDTLRSGVKFGYNVGGLISFPLKRNCAFLVEGGFSQQGRQWTYIPNDSKWTSTYYFADLSMALRKNFQLKVIKNVPSSWFFNVGPNINYWISGKGKFVPYQGPGSNPGYITNMTIVFDQEPTPRYTTLYVNNANRWLYGINLGIGFTMSTLRSQKIVAELRMTWGQTYLGQKNSETLNNLAAEGNMDLKCNLKVLNFSLAYIFERDIQKGRMGKSTKKVK